MPHLPDFDRIHRRDQHNDFQQQTVPYPNQQHHLSGEEDDQRTGPTQFPRQHEADAATHDVAQRIHHRVALVTQGRGRRSIVLNDCVCILD